MGSSARTDREGQGANDTRNARSKLATDTKMASKVKGAKRTERRHKSAGLPSNRAASKEHQSSGALSSRADMSTGASSNRACHKAQVPGVPGASSKRAATKGDVNDREQQYDPE